METKNRISFFFSHSFLCNRNVLWPLFVCNMLGTIYGFEWYRYQLIETIHTQPAWFAIFVPDSPTASLFFTISVCFLFWDQNKGKTGKQTGSEDIPLISRHSVLRGFVDAFAFITSYKYGIWAVAMIWAGNWKGLPLVWQDWMLMVSHLAMTMEVFIYAKWMKFTWTGILLAGSWTLLNDYMDYHYGIFSSLFVLLHPYLSIIQWFTVALSITGIGLAVFVLFKAKKHQRGM